MQDTLFRLKPASCRKFVYMQGDVCQTWSFVDFLLESYIEILVVHGVAYYEENTLANNPIEKSVC